MPASTTIIGGPSGRGPIIRGDPGENLSTSGLLDEDVGIGDEFQVGTACSVVTQPRMPCLKLGIRFGNPEIIKRFLESRRPGIYFGIVDEVQSARAIASSRSAVFAPTQSRRSPPELILDTSAPRSQAEWCPRRPRACGRLEEGFHEAVGLSREAGTSPDSLNENAGKPQRARRTQSRTRKDGDQPSAL